MSNLLVMKGISKSFSKNKVLLDVDFNVRAGEVHALLGENGAGKSTLVKILGGIYQADSGEIRLDGEKCALSDALDAQKLGISIIHQELMLMPHLSITENIFMGRELTGKLGLLNKKGQHEKAQELLNAFDMNFSAKTKLGKLTIAQQQMVEIIRAISFKAKIIAMDEPTSSLSEKEAEKLFELIGTLKERGMGIIFISHRLNDIFTLSDRVTVLRDGVNVGTQAIPETNEDELIKLMVGRDVKQFYARTASRATGEVRMEVEGLSDGKLAKDISFDLRKGEILGVSGLVGAGRSEAMQCIFGLSKRKAGTVKIDGKEVHFKAPGEAVGYGLGYVCEDRKAVGLFLKQNVRFNTSINVLGQFLSRGRYNRAKETRLATDYAAKLETKITGLSQITGFLSGGNQQKVLISRWLACTKNILLLDEPTRGVDVKTKQDIYALISELAQSGMSIVFISSELVELLNVCDRIMVLSDGRTTGVLERNEFDQEKIMKLATQAFHRKNEGEAHG